MKPFSVSLNKIIVLTQTFLLSEKCITDKCYARFYTRLSSKVFMQKLAIHPIIKSPYNNQSIIICFHKIVHLGLFVLHVNGKLYK